MYDKEADELCEAQRYEQAGLRKDRCMKKPTYRKGFPYVYLDGIVFKHL